MSGRNLSKSCRGDPQQHTEAAVCAYIPHVAASSPPCHVPFVDPSLPLLASASTASLIYRTTLSSDDHEIFLLVGESSVLRSDDRSIITDPRTNISCCRTPYRQTSGDVLVYIPYIAASSPPFTDSSPPVCTHLLVLSFST
jgi:hypothetical protein